MNSKIARIFAVVALTAVSQAQAVATTYNYVGPSFDSTLLSSGYVYDPALGNNITGSVTFNSDTSSFTGQISTTIANGVGNPQVLNLELTAGSFSENTSAFGSGSPLFGGFTFNNGQIIAWSVCGNSSAGGCEVSNVGIAGNGLSIIQVGGSILQPASDLAQEVATTIVDGQTHTLGARVNANCFFTQPGCVPDSAFGSWSEVADVSATPLPSAWLMLLSAFAGLGFFAYRGAKKNAAALAAA